MVLEVVHGSSRNPNAAVTLSNVLQGVVSEGTVFLGYPVLASAEDQVEVDALLICKEHGLVAFLLADSQPKNLSDWEQYIVNQDRLYAVLESHLGRHDDLRTGRRLAVKIQTATVFASQVSGMPGHAEGHFCGMEEVAGWVSGLEGLDDSVDRALHAALQRVTTIKPTKKRVSVRSDDSRGAVLKTIERNIANLDRWQKQAAIETPDGPQRI